MTRDRRRRGRRWEERGEEARRKGRRGSAGGYGERRENQVLGERCEKICLCVRAAARGERGSCSSLSDSLLLLVLQALH